MSAKENEIKDEKENSSFKTQEIQIVESKKENIVEKKDEKNESLKTQEVKEKKETEQVKKTEDKDKSKKNTYIAFNIVVFIILIFFFLIVFALINLNKNTIVNGVEVKNINLSGLSLEDAANKIEEAIKVETEKEINLIYNEKNVLTFKPSEIDFAYNTNEVVKRAYQVGRNDNIFINNFNILFAGLFGQEIDLQYTYNEEKLDEIINSLDGFVTGLVINPSYYREDSNLIIVPG